MCDTVDAKDISEEARVNTENKDEEASVHPDNFPKKLAKGKILLSKKQVAVARDEEGNFNTSTALMKLEICMDIMDKDDNNTFKYIYEAIHETYFQQVGLFTVKFLQLCKRNPNVPQNIPYDTNKYSQVAMICLKTEVEEEEIFQR